MWPYSILGGVHYLYEGIVMINWFIYIFASCVEGMAWVWNIIIVKKFNEDLDEQLNYWIGVAWIKISSSFAIPSYGCYQII